MAGSAPLPDADAPEQRDVRVRASLPTASRRNRLAPFISFVIHLILILLAIKLTADVALPAHSPIGDAIDMVLGGGGGGGQRGAAFQHPPPPPPSVAPQPVPVVPPKPTVIPPPEPVQQKIPAPVIEPEPAAPGMAAGGTGTGTGGGTGSGTGIGNGSGQGPGSGSGSGGGNGSGLGSRPDPRQLIIPPLDSPKQLRGRTVQVTFTVGADGRVIDIAVDPPISNRGYARRFDEAMREYQFRPARDPSGKAIQGVVMIAVTFSAI
ncbi:MAG: hypothetical protein ACREL5_06025 [Gemmatimonadales bacterium]